MLPTQTIPQDLVQASSGAPASSCGQTTSVAKQRRSALEQLPPPAWARSRPAARQVLPPGYLGAECPVWAGPGHARSASALRLATGLPAGYWAVQYYQSSMHVPGRVTYGDGRRLGRRAELPEQWCRLLTGLRSLGIAALWR